MNRSHALLKHESIIWGGRIILFITAGVFFDTLNRLYKIDAELHKDDHDGHHHHVNAVAGTMGEFGFCLFLCDCFGLLPKGSVLDWGQMRLLGDLESFESLSGSMDVWGFCAHLEYGLSVPFDGCERRLLGGH